MNCLFVEFIYKMSEVDNVVFRFVEGNKEVVGIYKISNDFVNGRIKVIEVIYGIGKFGNIKKCFLNMFSVFIFIGELLKLWYKFV